MPRGTLLARARASRALKSRVRNTPHIQHAAAALRRRRPEAQPTRLCPRARDREPQITRPRRDQGIMRVKWPAAGFYQPTNMCDYCRTGHAGRLGNRAC
jgi:hypothetical protein